MARGPGAGAGADAPAGCALTRFGAGLIALLVLLGGCAAPATHEGAVNLALFAPTATAPDSRPPGCVALLMPPQLQATLVIDLRLLDAQGHTVATRTYDGGREIWKAPPETFEWSADGIARLAREAAWRLAQQAVRDLRDWLEAERFRPREL